MGAVGVQVFPDRKGELSEVNAASYSRIGRVTRYVAAREVEDAETMTCGMNEAVDT